MQNAEVSSVPWRPLRAHSWLLGSNHRFPTAKWWEGISAPQNHHVTLTLPSLVSVSLFRDDEPFILLQTRWSGLESPSWEGGVGASLALPEPFNKASFVTINNRKK